MGCNQSTNNDIKESRQRAPPGTPGLRGSARSSTPVTSPTQTIGGAGRYGGGESTTDGLLLGTSYTDERTGQADFFKDIIQRTAENFIDVSQTLPSAPLEGKEVPGHVKKYSEMAVNTTTCELPTPSSNNDSPGSVLGSAVAVSTSDADLLRSVVVAFTDVIDNLSVPIGPDPLIATLPSI